ncbi:hypothetical protein H0E87_012471, partial [Populus deltoides]
MLNSIQVDLKAQFFRPDICPPIRHIVMLDISEEDLIYHDVNGYSRVETSSSRPHSSSSSHNIYRSNIEGSFSNYHIADTRPEIHRRRMTEVMEELPVNTRYEVITGCCDRGVAFIIQ